jgi:hypothetical protein
MDGQSWEEQEEVRAWMEETGITMEWPQQLDLQKRVSKGRMRLQNELSEILSMCWGVDITKGAVEAVRQKLAALSAATQRTDAAEEDCLTMQATTDRLREELAEQKRLYVVVVNSEVEQMKRAEAANQTAAKLRAVVGDLLKCDAWCPWCGVVVEYGEDNHQSWCKRQQALSALEGE